MSDPKNLEEVEELRKWSVEQAVQFSRHKEEYSSAGSITRVAEMIYNYVTRGTVLK
jgi:hypothetical protein